MKKFLIKLLEKALKKLRTKKLTIKVQARIDKENAAFELKKIQERKALKKKYQRNWYIRNRDKKRSILKQTLQAGNVAKLESYKQKIPLQKTLREDSARLEALKIEETRLLSILNSKKNDK